jgi:AraC-like DNA-binding protein
VSHRQIFDSLSKVVRFTEAWLVTSMPRGGLQIVQPAHIGERWVKPYSVDFHVHDATAWRAIVEDRAVRSEEAWTDGIEQSRFFKEFLQQSNLRHAISAPVKSAVFPGYDGALSVYSTAEQGPFSEAEVKAVTDAASQLEQAASAARASRITSHGECTNPPSWMQRANSRLIIFNANIKPIFNDGLSALDERLTEQLYQDARHRIQRLGNDASTSDRIAIPDARGQLWVFRAVAYKNYPALGTGPVIFYCLMPSYCDWISLRASDFSADAEITRLVPAMQFMSENFRRGPTLGEIAKHVHLSPFHFHRRFTELLGITPKHFLLECQIFHTKRLLFARETELAEISKVCGFAHQSHFTSRFKQFTGLTPTRWRKMSGKTTEETARARAEISH